MKSILMMSFANIKKRKVQSVLITLTIAVSSFLLSSAIGILSNINDPFRNMFEESKGSHLVLQTYEDSKSVHDMADWWASRSVIENTQIYNFNMVSEKIALNGTYNSMGDIMLTEYIKSDYDKLTIMEGEIKAAPGTDEIWIPTGYSYSWGIKPGDTLSIPFNNHTRDFLVTGIVVDPHYSSSMINPTRFWVIEGTLDNSLPSSGFLLGIRFHDYSYSDSMWQEFEEYMGKPFMGFKFDYETIEYTFNFIQSILGVIMLIFSLIIIAVSIFVMAYTISNSIANDYKTIGILKAMGFSSNGVKRIYLIQYVIMAFVALPIGVISSKYVVNMIMSQVIRTTGYISFESSILLPAIVTVVTVISAILAAGSISAKKAGKIKPTQAIREAAPFNKRNNRKSICISSLGSLKMPSILALKQIAGQKRQSFFLFVSVLVMALVLSFCINTYNSLLNMGENMAYWGFDDSDVVISLNAGYDAHEKLLNVAKSDERIKGFLPSSALINSAVAPQNGKTSINVVAFVYSGDMDKLGILNLEGRNPFYDNEVSISALTAKKYEKNVGDTIELFIEGKKATFIITGIYQSMNSMGWGFRLQESALHETDVDYTPERYLVKLTDKSFISEFVSDFKEKFSDEINIRLPFESGDINISDITQNMALVAMILSIVFIIVSFIIIFNFTMMSIHNEKKSFGIYKALGMTPLQLRMSLLLKVSILGLAGTLIGIPISLNASSWLLGMMLSNVGMVRFPFVVTVPGTIIAALVCILVASFSAWLPSGRILGINPRNLIVE